MMVTAIISLVFLGLFIVLALLLIGWFYKKDYQEDADRDIGFPHSRRHQ